MVKLTEKTGNNQSFDKLPSLMLLKKDIYRFLIFKDTKNAKALLDKVRDDAYLEIKVDNDFNKKYFNNNGECSFRKGSGESLTISISLTIGSEFSSSINFGIEMFVKLKDQEDGELIHLQFPPEGQGLKKVNLLDFLNEWTSYDWKRLFDSAINQFRNDLNIKTKSDNDGETDSSKSISNLDRFIQNASNDIETIKFNNSSELSAEIFNLCDDEFESQQDVLDRLLKFYTSSEANESTRGQLVTAMVKNTKDVYLDLLKDIEM